MAVRGKAVAILLGSIVLLGTGLAMASDKKKKQYSPAPTDEDEDEDDDLEIVLPDEGGAPGKGPVIKVKDTDGDVDDDDDDDQTDIDGDLEVIAEDEGVTQDEAVKEVVDEVTGGEKAPPIALEETTPAMDPHGTVKLARLLLARETLPDWKADTLDGDIGEWQSGVGLTPDNKFGINSATRMAEEVGILPLVRYWPKGTASKADAEKRYDSAISGVIGKLKSELPDSQAHIDALTASMNREVAVTLGSKNPPPQKTREFALDVNHGIAEAAELKGEADLKKGA